jgi:hypothetical protein
MPGDGGFSERVLGVAKAIMQAALSAPRKFGSAGQELLLEKSAALRSAKHQGGVKQRSSLDRQIQSAPVAERRRVKGDSAEEF